MKTLKYKLNDEVILKASNEAGIITGRAQFTNSEPTYLILYKSADGRQVEGWWAESTIAKAAALTA